MARALLIALAGLTYLLVLGPILIVLVTAFSPTEFFVFPPPSLSLRWFATSSTTESLRDAFLRSLWLAALSCARRDGPRHDGGAAIARRRGLAFTLAAEPVPGAADLPGDRVRAVAAAVLQADRRHAGVPGARDRPCDPRHAVRGARRVGERARRRSGARGGEPEPARRPLADLPPRHHAADLARHRRRARCSPSSSRSAS